MCGHQLPLNYSLSSFLAHLTQFHPTPCSISMFGSPGWWWPQNPPGAGRIQAEGTFLQGLSFHQGSWAALRSHWEKQEHLPCSPTDVLSLHPNRLIPISYLRLMPGEQPKPTLVTGNTLCHP